MPDTNDKVAPKQPEESHSIWSTIASDLTMGAVGLGLGGAAIVAGKEAMKVLKDNKDELIIMGEGAALGAAAGYAVGGFLGAAEGAALGAGAAAIVGPERVKSAEKTVEKYAKEFSEGFIDALIPGRKLISNPTLHKWLDSFSPKDVMATSKH